MSLGSNQEYLLNDQYKDSSNLHARVQLHLKFSTNAYGWHRWVFDQLLSLPSDSSILEVGCGPCYLWQENKERIPDTWHVTLSDFSPGMVRKAQENVAVIPHDFNFHGIDVQSIPFDDRSLDAVIANHMLYHVPNLSKALAEIRRVLKPSGRLYAATNGANHHRQMGELRRKFVAASSIQDDFATFDAFDADSFGLENGERLLAPWFTNVTSHRYEDALAVTEVEPLWAYILSGISYNVPQDRRADFRHFLEQELEASDGVIHIDKDGGLFVAEV